MLGSFFTQQRAITPEEISALSDVRPSAMEGLSAQMAQAFDRTTAGRMVEDTQIAMRERAAGEYDEGYAQNRMMAGMFGLSEDTSPMGPNKYAITEEEWKASPYYNPKIKYSPDMTETRARTYAENFAKRRYQDEIIAKADQSYGMIYKVAGFGAMLIGSLPDPVNFVPFAGGVGKGLKAAEAATTAGKAFGAGFKVGAKSGAIEGAAGAALADALVLPQLAERGEDVGFVDALMDTAFGGILGVGIGGLGGGLGAWRGYRRQLEFDKVIDGTRRELDAFSKDAEFGTPDAGFLESVGMGSAERAAMLSRNEVADLLRAGLSGKDRRDIFRAQEKAIADIMAGRPVDVSDILRNSPALKNADAFVRQEMAKLGKAYDQVHADPLGGDMNDVMAVLSPENLERVLVHRGPAMEIGSEIVVTGKDLMKAKGSFSGFGIVKIIFGHGEEAGKRGRTKLSGKNKKPMPPVTREDVIALPNTMREWNAIDEQDAWIWRIPREDGNTLNIAVRKSMDGADARLVSMYVRGEEKGLEISTRKKPGSESSNPVSGGVRDTSQGLTQSPDGGQNGAAQMRDPNLVQNGPEVNYATEAVDEIESVSSERMTLDEEDNLAMARADEANARVEQLYESGALSLEDIAPLREAQEARVRAEQYGEMGQAVMECVLEVPNA